MCSTFVSLLLLFFPFSLVSSIVRGSIALRWRILLDEWGDCFDGDAFEKKVLRVDTRKIGWRVTDFCSKIVPGLLGEELGNVQDRASMPSYYVNFRAC